MIENVEVELVAEIKPTDIKKIAVNGTYKDGDGKTMTVVRQLELPSGHRVVHAKG